MRPRTLIGPVALSAASLLLAACGGGDAASSDPDTLTLWHFESADSAMGVAWDEAIDTFEEETGATVVMEAKSFEQIRQTSSQVLNSDQAPDVLEYPKGNATAGLLASQGLLSPLTGAVEEYGWDDQLSPALQTTARYDERGVMGSGEWYGVPNYGEFVTMYYNRTAFEEAGLEVPTTLAELEDVMATFEADGTTPLAESALEYPLGQLMYQLALTRADRQFVDDYQLYENPVDFTGPELEFGAQTIADWVEAGYISPQSSGLKAEDAGTAFISGEHPLFFSGSWWYGRFTEEIDGFEWGTFSFPEADLVPGSAGNMWVVPTRAANPDLAEQFIDITMRPEIQATLGNNGGLPVAAEIDDITDPSSRDLIESFNAVNERDGLAFYPDWPTPTFYDEIVSETQQLVNGTQDVPTTLSNLGDEYDSYVDDVR